MVNTKSSPWDQVGIPATIKTPQLEQILSKLKSWLSDHPEIKNCFIVGSFATGKTDQYSDLDLIFIVEAEKIDQEALQFSIKQLLDTQVDLSVGRLTSSGAISYWEKKGWGEARTLYKPSIVVLGSDLSSPLDHQARVMKLKNKIIHAKEKIDERKIANAENPHVLGVFDFIQHDKKSYLVLRTFFTFFSTYQAFALETSRSPLAIDGELEEFLKRNGRRVSVHDTPGLAFITRCASMIEKVFSNI